MTAELWNLSHQTLEGQLADADFLAALLARFFLGAFPPVDFLAVCLVRAMSVVEMELMTTTVYSCLYKSD